MGNSSDDKHSCNYKNRDGTGKIIQPRETCISGGTNKLYWKRPSKISRRTEPIRARAYVIREDTLLIL